MLYNKVYVLSNWPRAGSTTAAGVTRYRSHCREVPCWAT